MKEKRKYGSRESVLCRDEIATALHVMICDVNTVLVGRERMKLHA